MEQSSNITEAERLECTIYLYDLPKAEYSSQKLAAAMKELADIALDEPPII